MTFLDYLLLAICGACLAVLVWITRTA